MGIHRPSHTSFKKEGIMLIKWHKTQIGETRERQVFCLLPRRLDADHVVWLEWITVTEQCTYNFEHSGAYWSQLLVERGAFAYPRKKVTA